MFERIHELSATGSRIGVESFGAGFFDSDYLASRREQLRKMQEEAGAGDKENAFDVEDLWFIEERTDVADWLTERGWELASFEAAELMERYGRSSPGQVDDASPRTVFIEGKLIG